MIEDVARPPPFKAIGFDFTRPDRPAMTISTDKGPCPPAADPPQPQVREHCTDHEPQDPGPREPQRQAPERERLAVGLEERQCEVERIEDRGLRIAVERHAAVGRRVPERQLAGLVQVALNERELREDVEIVVTELGVVRVRARDGGLRAPRLDRERAVGRVDALACEPSRGP